MVAFVLIQCAVIWNRLRLLELLLQGAFLVNIDRVVLFEVSVRLRKPVLVVIHRHDYAESVALIIE